MLNLLFEFKCETGRCSCSGMEAWDDWDCEEAVCDSSFELCGSSSSIDTVDGELTGTAVSDRNASSLFDELGYWNTIAR